MEMKGEGPKQSKNQSVKELGFLTYFFFFVSLSFINSLPRKQYQRLMIFGITLSVLSVCVQQTRRNPRYVTASNLLVVHEIGGQKGITNRHTQGFKRVPMICLCKNTGQDNFLCERGRRIFHVLYHLVVVVSLNLCLCNGTCVTPR
jgi:hypothetical protein